MKKIGVILICSLILTPPQANAVVGAAASAASRAAAAAAARFAAQAAAKYVAKEAAKRAAEAAVKIALKEAAKQALKEAAKHAARIAAEKAAYKIANNTLGRAGNNFYRYTLVKTGGSIANNALKWDGLSSVPFQAAFSSLYAAPGLIAGLIGAAAMWGIVYGITQIPVINDWLNEEIMPTVTEWWYEIKSWFGDDEEEEVIVIPEPTPTTNLPTLERINTPDPLAKNESYISDYESTASYMTATTCPEGKEEWLADIKLVQGATDELVEEFQRYHDLKQCVKFYIAHENAYTDEGWAVDSHNFQVIEGDINQYISGGGYVRGGSSVNIEVSRNEDGLYDLGFRESVLEEEASGLRKQLSENDSVSRKISTLRAYLKTLKDELEMLKNPELAT